MAGAPGWSLFVRLSHWLVAAGVLVNLFNDTGWWHRSIGYAAFALIGLRLLHGMSSRHPSSRFWWPRGADIHLHLQHLWRRSAETHAGHNALGQYAVYLMWLLIALLALTGWLSRTDAYWGEDWPVDLHALLANALLGMVLLHVTAVFALSWLQRRNLLKAMLRG